MLEYLLMFNRQGDVRLQKWFVARSFKETKTILHELIALVVARKPEMCAFVEYGDATIVYKRYKSLYFCCAIEQADNQLMCLEFIHRYVELLDDYFGCVCELDIVWNFEKAYHLLDEFLLAGEVQETSRKLVLKHTRAQDVRQEEETEQGMFEDYGLG
ncbi:AP complex subunit sigma [Aphelenchoides fujianensis]|nr:AP complex subunit sigma [Aphelenchoides fujianensis]KAI6225116.1 AP complex subunit sigma [Aphelenchoides fujianensis]